MFFDFLDGFRGTLAYWVLLSHVKLWANLTGDYDYLINVGYFIGVIGFFLLSSFLLTFRLIEELKKDGDDPIPILLIFIKYFVRRFFRIYIPYAIFVTVAKFVFPWIAMNKLEEHSWFQLLILNHNTITHLWTIPPEIKYYFFIPLFAYLTHLLNKNTISKLLWILILAIFLFITEYFNLFGIQFDENGIFLSNVGSLLSRFTTFLLGSYLAVIIYFVLNLEIFKNYEDSKYFRAIFGTISMIFYLGGMILFSGFHNRKIISQNSPISMTERYSFRCGVYWAVFLFFFIIGGKNYFTNFFLFKLFTYGGKISFGFYLYHEGIIYLVVQKFENKIEFQFELILISFIGTFFIGFLHYCYVEKNLIKMANFICKYFESLNFFKRKLHDMAFYQKTLTLIEKANAKLTFHCCKRAKENEEVKVLGL